VMEVQAVLWVAFFQAVLRLSEFLLLEVQVVLWEVQAEEWMVVEVLRLVTERVVQIRHLQV